MTHDVYGYRNGKPFAVLTRRFGAGMRYEQIDAAPEPPLEAQPLPAEKNGSMLWRTTQQMRTALELLPDEERHAAQRRFISDLLEASREEGGVWVRFS